MLLESILGSIEPGRVGVYHQVQLKAYLRMCLGMYLQENWQVNLRVTKECTKAKTRK